MRIWEHELKHAPIGTQEDFFDLGGTSVQAARIFAADRRKISQAAGAVQHDRGAEH